MGKSSSNIGYLLLDDERARHGIDSLRLRRSSELFASAGLVPLAGRFLVATVLDRVPVRVCEVEARGSPGAATRRRHSFTQVGHESAEAVGRLPRDGPAEDRTDGPGQR